MSLCGSPGAPQGDAAGPKFHPPHTHVHHISDHPFTVTSSTFYPAVEDDDDDDLEPLHVSSAAAAGDDRDDDLSLNDDDDDDWNFTSDELLAVLPPPDDDDEYGLGSLWNDDDDNPSSLPDIYVSAEDWNQLRDNLDDDDDDELQLPVDWEHVFDDVNSRGTPPVQEQQQQQDDDKPIATAEQDTTTLELLAQLEGLQLDNPNPDDGDSDNFDWMEDIVNQEYPPIYLPNGDIQPWLYCHPCATTKTTSTTTTHVEQQQPQQQEERKDSSSDTTLQPFLEPWNQHPPQEGAAATTDIDHLLSQLAIFNDDNNKDYPQQLPDDEGEEEEKKYNNDETNKSNMESSNPEQPPSTASTATASPQQPPLAMQTLLQSFGITNTASDGDGKTDEQAKNSTSPSKNRQLCLGHRERILGVDISPDGRYFATASADSTVRIWRDRRLVATLRGHDTAHECLRVAWASSRWIQTALPEAVHRTPVRPHHDETVKTTVPPSGADDPPSRPQAVTAAYVLATGGADGVVYLWMARTASPQEDPTDWRICATLDHRTWRGKSDDDDDDDETPQIYSLALIDDWHGLPSHEDNAFCLTSSDDHVHLWEWSEASKKAKIDDGWSADTRTLREVFSVRFGPWQDTGYGVTVGQVTGSAVLDLPLTKDAVARDGTTASHLTDDQVFGGTHRNPQGIVYVFDAAYSAALGCLGVALSDGTVRLLNGRGVCWSVLQLPHVQAHLTALSWSPTTNILATAVATGEVVTWGVWPGHTPICRAILAGGHEPGRPLFGVGFYGTTMPGSDDDDDPHTTCHDNTPPPPEALVSWGVDGRLCVWEPISEGTVDQPVATLVHNSEYPLYAVAMCKDKLVAAGGGPDGGLIGIPVHLYDLEVAEHTQVVASHPSASSSSSIQVIPEAKTAGENNAKPDAATAGRVSSDPANTQSEETAEEAKDEATAKSPGEA